MCTSVLVFAYRGHFRVPCEDLVAVFIAERGGVVYSCEGNKRKENEC